MKDGESRKQTEIAVFSLLEHGLTGLGSPADSDTIRQLTDLVMLLDHWAQRINLTGHRDPLSMAQGLVLDAAALSATLPELLAAKSLTDLGSGAGFPGLPLAILHPDLEVRLVDSRLKRNHFQRAVRRELKLTHVQSILGRSDEVEAVASDVVVAQAMTQPEQALELMIPWSRPGGLVVLPASEAAVRPDAPDAIAEMELREYRVPESGIRRKLWVARVRTS